MTEKLVWYSPGEVRFTFDQVMWLLEHWDMLSTGRWPPNPKETGYTDAPLRGKGGTKRAPFINAIEVVAEISARLSRCGKDGQLVILVYGKGWEDYLVADLLEWDIRKLRWHLKKSLAYCVGWRRRACSYQDFIGHRRKEAQIGSN